MLSAMGSEKVPQLTATIASEDDGYVAQCVEVDIASQGDTIEEAVANLVEALALHFEDSSEKPSVALSQR